MPHATSARATSSASALPPRIPPRVLFACRPIPRLTVLRGSERQQRLTSMTTLAYRGRASREGNGRRRETCAEEDPIALDHPAASRPAPGSAPGTELLASADQRRAHILELRRAADR